MSYLQRYLRNVGVADFIRYTFTPAFSLMMLIGALTALVSMAVTAYRALPLVAKIFFFGYTGLFLVVMLLSWLRWIKHKLFR